MNEASMVVVKTELDCEKHEVWASRMDNLLRLHVCTSALPAIKIAAGSC